MLELDLPALAGAFGRRLHDGGVAMTPARCADLARALALVAPITRRRLYWTARTVAVSEPAQVRAFDAVFFSVFGSRADGREFEPPQASSAAAPADQRAPSVRDRPPPAPDGDEARASVSLSRAGGRDADDQAPELEVPLAMASDEELLRARSFDALEPEELAQLHRLMSLLAVETPLRRLRRHEKGRHGEQIDLRRTLRGSLRTGGDPIRLARRRRRIARRRLVMLCDISGSMEPYARAYLQFLACAAAGGRDTEAFVFATRLTRVTRALAARSHERAIARAAAAAPDWSSGTRIGDALKTFNDRHGRRGMARGAVVVILSDGWERGDPALVAREMERLGRLAHRIVWVNPRAGASSFSVAAGGMVAALPHCDALVSGHSFEALGEVVAAIGASSRSSRGGPAAGWKPGAAAEIEVPEPWASATPVPGSSVAMPSGHGPKRGVTTPGWTNERGE
jgi:uncharacterized protein with von Willebrand factor type A (vWA) domain